MSWSNHNVDLLFDGMKSIFTAPYVIITYYGWYGVPVFLFLSGFGLAAKYGSRELSKVDFVKKHILKLFWLMIPGYVIFLSLHIFAYGIEYPFSLIVKQCTFTANILAKAMNPGVYWFFGLMAQFYLIFLLIRKWDRKKLVVFMVLGIVFDYLVLYLANKEQMIHIRHNSIGWFSSFLFGIICGKSKDFKLNHIMMFLIPLLFVVSALVKSLHPFSPLLAIASFLIVAKSVRSGMIKYVGVLSASLFAMHPLSRLIMNNSLCDLPLALKVVIYMLIAFVFAHFYSKLQKYISAHLLNRV